MPSVIIDSREPQEIKTYLKRHYKNKINFTIAALPEGDYSTEHCIVERKKIGDLYSSIMDGRLKNQCCRMAMHGAQHPIIVVHGNLAEYIKEQRIKRKIIINERLITSAIAEAKCRYNIMIIWVEDLHCMLNIMINLMMDIEDGKYGQPATCKPEQLISRLLNITPKQFEELKKTCGSSSLLVIGKCSKSIIMKTKGIGEVKALHILKVLNGK